MSTSCVAAPFRVLPTKEMFTLKDIPELLTGQ